MKKAFTLAEVLITLGIIGIVAAMTLPSLIANYQKKVTVNRLKQAYSMINHALLLAQKDYDEPKYWYSGTGLLHTGTSNAQTASKKWVETYFIPYLKGAKVHGFKSLKEMGYKTPYVALNGKPISNGNLTKLNDTANFIELNNSILLTVGYDNKYINGEDGDTALTDILFRVDINGRQKPNMYGRDMFAFHYSAQTGKLLYFGYNPTYTRDDVLNKYCSKSVTNNGNLACSGVIMLDGWEIKDDYPW